MEVDLLRVIGTPYYITNWNSRIIYYELYYYNTRRKRVKCLFEYNFASHNCRVQMTLTFRAIFSSYPYVNTLWPSISLLPQNWFPNSEMLLYRLDMTHRTILNFSAHLKGNGSRTWNMWTMMLREEGTWWRSNSSNRNRCRNHPLHRIIDPDKAQTTKSRRS